MGLQIVFDVDECGVEVGRDFGERDFGQFERADQFQYAQWLTRTVRTRPLILARTEMPSSGDQFAGGQLRGGDEARLNADGAERGFVAGDDFERE